MSTNDSFSWGADTVGQTVAGRGPVAASRRTSLLGGRMAAVIIDHLVLLVPVLAIAWLLSRTFPYHGFFFSRSGVSASSTGSTTSNYRLGAPGLLIILALSLSYFFVFEAVRGQTIGKRAMGLHVRAASGGRAGFNAISARTVLRLIDALPLFYLLGTLVALLGGSRRRRIGDWAGGTVVVCDGDVADEEPERPGWRVAVYPALWLSAVLLATFALGLGKAAGQRERALAQHPACAEAGIGTPEGREGVCTEISGPAGAIAVHNVVDGAHALRMPEYEARLLDSQASPTHVTNSSENESIYPGGRGELVSLQIAITNTGSRPLQFGEASDRPAFYPTHATVELALPRLIAPTDLAYPAILNGRRAPTPSIFQAQPIVPGGRRVGWATFVAPPWALSVLHARPADVVFLRPGGGRSYFGEIRLWK
jgi:uncharacterized RDD family membrane protein YckC